MRQKKDSYAFIAAFNTLNPVLKHQENLVNKMANARDDRIDITD